MSRGVPADRSSSELTTTDTYGDEAATSNNGDCPYGLEDRSLDQREPQRFEQSRASKSRQCAVSLDFYRHTEDHSVAAPFQSSM